MEDVFAIPSLVIPSYQVGLDKPNIEIYKATFNRIKCVDSQINPEEVLFIDDKDRNLITAKGYLPFFFLFQMTN
jgi:FMN phosphatase YigB (HAD superfamily)